MATTATPSSIYRDGLQISPERIAAFGDDELNNLMRELLIAQAYQCSAAIDQVIVNTEGRAKDDGADGMSPTPQRADLWLGTNKTCWQFKAGVAGEPNKLRGEVLKRIPTETLQAGGRFIVVCCASSNGQKGIDDRKAYLDADARTAGLPVENIHVFGSEQLANWCNQHPAIALQWGGKPSGLWTIQQWDESPVHQSEWQASAETEERIESARQQLDFKTGDLWHLHIQGPPGVGKSRLALELCKGAAWKSSALYIRQAADIPLLQLIGSAADDKGAQLLIAVDEVQPEQLAAIRDALDLGNGRIRLITIGHCRTPDPSRIPELDVRPLTSAQMSAIVRGWNDKLPLEHVDFIVHLADGYVRLAKLASEAVLKDPSVNVRQILDLHHIRLFFNKMLGDQARRQALHVVAVLTRVGWEGDVEVEGKAIAAHLGLDWNHIRGEVLLLDRDLGIAPRGGRYRYISPIPLGIYLAMEAWEIYPNQLKTLPEALPSEAAKAAYFECIQRLASSPQVKEFSREGLKDFFDLSSFSSALNARRWAALAAGDEILAAEVVKTALSNASLEDRLNLNGQARRTIIWTLVRLCWNYAAYRNSVFSLALLAEAENETWGNNATGEFQSSFDLLLGGTPVPFFERLLVVDELLQRESLPLTILSIKTLSKSAREKGSRLVTQPLNNALQPEWRPSTLEERNACVSAAIERLISISRNSKMDIRDALIEAVKNVSIELLNDNTRDITLSFFNEIRRRDPETRELIRREIWEIIKNDKKYWNSLSDSSLALLMHAHSTFEDHSLSSRLKQFCGPSSWGLDEGPDLTPIASELVLSPAALQAEWAWLTSGEAGDSWRLGQALADADPKNTLDAVLPALNGHGPDMRLICAYANQRRKQYGDGWFDDWMTSVIIPNHGFGDLFFELIWRCTVTTEIANILIQAIKGNWASSDDIARLGFGDWPTKLSFEAAKELFQSLVDTGNSSIALSALNRRLLHNETETVDSWKDLAYSLSVNPSLVRSEGMMSHYWKEIASKVAPIYPGEISAAIFKHHALKDSSKHSSWFIDHSDGKDVLLKCVMANPNAVWDALTPFIENPETMYFLTIGFPRNVINQLPKEKVLDWVKAAPEQRGPVIGRLTDRSFLDDDSIGSVVLGDYADLESVSQSFFAEYVSGGWTGPTSKRWHDLAAHLDQVYKSSNRPKLRQWAFKYAGILREMEKREIDREQEQGLGHF